MQAFEIHKQIVENYKEYLKSFINIKNDLIRREVEKAFEAGRFLPEALVQFNPSFELGASLDDLANEGVIRPELRTIFGDYRLYYHQVAAIRKGIEGDGFVVTSGTGSGKSLTFLATIFDHIIRFSGSFGVQAIIVYPMNALINSQEEEIKKYELNFLMAQWTGGELPANLQSLDEKVSWLKQRVSTAFPITYGKYTGQEDDAKRRAYQENPPSIILTNYMMLELIMTRNSENWLRKSMEKHLKFLVFDELHTYRGRQGADVAMLIRRIKRLVQTPIVTIGTSATMATGDSPHTRKEAVAKVANEIFDTQFSAEDVIEEEIRNCTTMGTGIPDRGALQEGFARSINPEDGAEVFVKHPLAVWLENAIALKITPENRFERGTPLSISEIALRLADASGEPQANCRDIIVELLRWAERLNQKGANMSPRQSFLPYKFHQFISQTGNVYVTLDSKEKRHITLDMERYLHDVGSQKDLLLFPVLFSRHSGYDFICVRKVGGQLQPRDPDDLPERITKESLKGDPEKGVSRRQLVPEDFLDGYLLIPEEGDVLWADEDLDNLPDYWFLERKGGRRLDNFYEHRIPQKIYFDLEGNFSTQPIFPTWGWFMAAPLLFDPSSGVIFDTRTKEITKLMRLGNEGRSTATTIISLSVIKTLQAHQLPATNQKVLSFTDNRQDASLQAGHFNDFMMLGRMRSAIYYALKAAEGHSLEIDNIAIRVCNQLRLREEEYAREVNQDPSWPDERNVGALREYIKFRILYDLKRGWRYNTPNLEQTGLLKIGYRRLIELSQEDALFSDLGLLAGESAANRLEVLTQVLDYFRTNFAIDDPRLVGTSLEETVERIRQRLDQNKLWSLDENEQIDAPYTLLPDSVKQVKGRHYTASIGPLSYLGKYLKRYMGPVASEPSLPGAEPPTKTDRYIAFVRRICDILVQRNLLKSIKLPVKDGGETTGYRLRTDAIIWQLGDGLKVPIDRVRVTSLRSVDQQPNRFFQRFYQQDFSVFGRTLVGAEHTGQLDNQDRMTREEQFRKGEIAALFCSPTMELGIDISDLGIVHMRNVPPNPANYAQRSGRAGRSGQAALVYTYCSNGSPHDRNYFRDRTKMVAGSVFPPKIDLHNEELIRTHFHAYILMEMGLRDLVQSVGDVLEIGTLPTMPIKPQIRAHMEDHVRQFSREWISSFRLLLEGVHGLKNSYWYSDVWLERIALDFVIHFDHAFDRWRTLYLNANKLIAHARAVIDDPTLKQDSPQKREAKREQAVGIRQRDLLRNDQRSGVGSHSEFYVYRYLAAEGFLPGYGFTRLPVRAFLGYRHLDQGEFISRPRFIGLREFGPNNLIYHNGGKYRISKMLRASADQEMHTLKLSRSTGYAFLDGDAQAVNNDPITGVELKGQDQVLTFNRLLELGESEARPQERISCEEEERMSLGYELESAFSFTRGFDKTRQVIIQEGGEPLLRVIFDHSAQLLQVNRGWRKSVEKDGFKIGRSSGRWIRARDIDTEKPEEEVEKAVMLYTTDTSDILYLQPVASLDLKVDEMGDGIQTLAYALKHAIESVFQVESREIGVWVLGDGAHSNILLYEAAEGSLGIMSMLIEDANSLKRVFREAYRLLHFDPDLREDVDPSRPKASYLDLLSYYNQRYHHQLDRHLVKAALERLMDAQIDQQQQGRSQADQYQYLLRHLDPNASTEKRLVDFLYQGGYALPDKAQVNLAECYVSADFVYNTAAGSTILFCDGNVHDRADVQAEDRRKRACARDHYDVIIWHHSEDLEQLVARRKDIFRKIR